jgi:cyclomaltodextrinase
MAKAEDTPAGLPPPWVADAIFYQIFPDRFATSARVRKPGALEAWDAPPTPHGFKGGDLLGVLERLDHIAALGANAIYLNPIFSSASNHRYHTFDYFQVDPLLGGTAAFRELLDAAHARGIRVVLDGVFNHASRGFWPFHHLMENGAQSPYADWFTVAGWPLNAYAVDEKPNYLAWWGLSPLPKLNVANEDVREYLLDVAEHWVEFGIDGWRLDVPTEIDDVQFWREFRRRVRRANPEAYLVGEIWQEAGEWLEGDRFDALMNYPFARTALGFCAAEALHGNVRVNEYVLESLDAATALAQLTQQSTCYRSATVAAQLNLLGSHDTPRFLTLAEGDHSAVALATLLQMTLPGAPCVYYGDEIGMEGAADPDCRRAFPWLQEYWHQPTWDVVRRATALRHSEAALRRGALQPLAARVGCLAFLRRLEEASGDALVVAVNASRKTVRMEVELPLGLELSEATELWDTSALPPSLSTEGDSRRLRFDVGAREGRVLRLAVGS